MPALGSWLELALSRVSGRISDTSDGPLQHRIVEGGLVATLRFLSKEGRISGGVEMGVYTAAGACLPESLLVRNGRRHGRPGRFQAGMEIDEDVIYGGILSAHFGHFLLEGLARLWCAQEYPDHPIVWVVGQARIAELRSWHISLLEPLIGKRRHIILREPTRFRSVVSADAGFRIPDRLAERHRHFLEGYGVRHAPEPGRKLWLSRSGVEPDGGLLNAITLERHLEAAGWVIFRPEEQSVADQIHTLSTAERIAAEEGSALHLLLLLEECKELRVDILARRREARLIRDTYSLIADEKAFAQELHSVQSEKIVTRRRAQFTRITSDFAEHLDALGVPERPLPEPTPAVSETLLGWASRNGRFARTLQIGLGSSPVLHQGLADEITVLTATARIDPRAAARAEIEVLEMSPDFALDHFPDRIAAADLLIVAESTEATDDIDRLWQASGAEVLLITTDMTLPDRLRTDTELAGDQPGDGWMALRRQR